MLGDKSYLCFFFCFYTSKALSRVKVLLVQEVQIPVVKIGGLYIVLDLGVIYCVYPFLFSPFGFFLLFSVIFLKGGWVLFLKNNFYYSGFVLKDYILKVELLDESIFNSKMQQLLKMKHSLLVN